MSRDILYLCPRQFWPADTGGKLRNLHLARQLSLGFDVTCVTFAEAGSPRTPPAEIAAWLTDVVVVDQPQASSVLNLARGAVGPVPYSFLNYTSDAFEQAIRDACARRSFAAVQIESVHLLSYLPVIRSLLPEAKVVMDWHNIESELMARFAEQQGNALKRFYARQTARKIEAWERRALDELDAVTVTSVREKDRLTSEWGARVPIFAVENGIDVASIAPSVDDPNATESDTLVFIGSMDYHANVDGIVWFGREVWPAVHEALPDLTVEVVGRRPTDEVRALDGTHNIHVVGDVPAVSPYYRKALASLVTLRTGSGTRLKVLESLAAEVPVVTTAIGSEGIDVVHEEHVLFAETAGDFIAAFQRLRDNEAFRAGLVQRASDFVKEHYDWQVPGAKLRDVYARLLPDLQRAAE